MGKEVAGKMEATRNGSSGLHWKVSDSFHDPDWHCQQHIVLGRRAQVLRYMGFDCTAPRADQTCSQ